MIITSTKLLIQSPLIGCDIILFVSPTSINSIGLRRLINRKAIAIRIRRTNNSNAPIQYNSDIENQ